MAAHTGTSWGYGGLATLLPDRHLAIYTGITGPDKDYHGRRLLHMYTMDLLLGVEPWLNLTTACTFLPDRRRRKTVKTEPSQVTISLSDYTGTFGNFGYGNVTVYDDNSRLTLKYVTVFSNTMMIHQLPSVLPVDISIGRRSVKIELDVKYISKLSGNYIPANFLNCNSHTLCGINYWTHV